MSSALCVCAFRRASSSTMLGQSVRRFTTSVVRRSHYEEGPGKVSARAWRRGGRGDLGRNALAPLPARPGAAGDPAGISSHRSPDRSSCGCGSPRERRRPGRVKVTGTARARGWESGLVLINFVPLSACVCLMITSTVRSWYQNLTRPNFL